MGMPGPMPPPPPVPSADHNTQAMREYRKRRAEVANDRKWHLATVLVLGALTVAAAVIGILGLLYLEFGLNGPLGAIVIGGLVTLTVVEVHKRL